MRQSSTPTIMKQESQVPITARVVISGASW